MRASLEKRVRRCIVQQLDASDCGAACIATVIRFYGGSVQLERIRELTGTGPSGTTMLGLLRAGPSLGLTIEGFEGDCRALKEVDCPCILHVATPTGAYHFTVCFGFAGDRFVIGDPASGLRRIAERELETIWRSRALLTVRPSRSFITQKARSEEKRKWLMEAVREDVHSLTLAVVLGALISTFGLAVALFSQALLDDILPNRDDVKLVVGLALVAFFLVVQNALTAARQLILIRQARAFNNRIIHHFVDSLVFLPFPFFASRKAGDLIARLNDTGRLQRFVTFAVGGVMINALMLVTAFVFIISYSLLIGLWVVGGLALLGLCSAASHRPIVVSQISVMSARAVNESRYVDSIRGIEAIKSTNSERFFAAAMKSTFAAFQDAVFRLGRVGVSFNFGAQMAGLVIVLGVIGWGASLVLDEALQIGALVALIQMTNMLIPAAYGLALSNIELQEASVAFDRMYQFSSLKPEYSASTSGMHAPSIDRFEVEKLCFRFPGRSPLFSDVSFTVDRGEVVLLVGRTGSGKSTFLRILLRLYHPERGHIRINGHDWSSIPTDVWRGTAAMVPQHVQVFSGSLAENICMRAVKDVEPVARVCRSLGLEAIFRALPHGYATLLGEGGVRLSGGQQRLLGLARALYRRPQILLVDELVTGLDRSASKRVVEMLRRRKPNMATVIVSHREDFTALADRAYLIENSTMRELERGRTAVSR